VTDPPEPRRPEEGGGEENSLPEEQDAYDNATADELMDQLEDDALLDAIRDGVQGDLGPDELTELLGTIRDNPDARDIPVPITGRIERGENLTPQREGASQPMATTAENMAIVRQQTAKAGEAAAAITHAMDLLRDAATQIGGVSGDLPGPNRAMAACTDAASQLEQLQGMVMGLSNIIEEAAANPQAG
jgi:hypothetical protein